jgi:hypothetical protein
MLINDVGKYRLACPFCFRRIAHLASRTNQSPYRGDYLFCPCGEAGVLADRSSKKSSRSRAWRVRKPTPQERVRIAVLKRVN